MCIHGTGVVSSNAACLPIKTPLLKKVTGNHLKKPSFLAETQSSVSGSATLKIEYWTQVHNMVKGNRKIPICQKIQKNMPSEIYQGTNGQGKKSALVNCQILV